MTTTELATVDADRPTKLVSVEPYAYWPMNERVAYARMLAGAKELLPKGLRSQTVDETAAKVFLVLETGAMLGLHPMAAFQGIDIIEGSATISPRLFTALARQAGMKLREAESGSIRTGDYTFTVTLIRPDDPDWPITRSFGLEDAVQAGLCKVVQQQDGTFRVEARSSSGAVKPWEAYPKDMVQWRAYGRLMRGGAADVTSGIGYFPEELEVMVTESGEVMRDDGQIEERLIEVIKGMDDKADLARVWGEHNPKGDDGKSRPDDVWSDRVQAEFAAHLLTVKKDSRPPKDGAPGHTGETSIDTPAPDQDAADGEPEIDPVTGGTIVDGMTEEEWEAAELAKHEAEIAAQEAAQKGAKK